MHRLSQNSFVFGLLQFAIEFLNKFSGYQSFACQDPCLTLVVNNHIDSLEFNWQITQPSPHPVVAVISENHIGRIGSTPFVVSKAKVGYYDQERRIFQDMKSDKLEVGTAQVFVKFAGPTDLLIRTWEFESNCVFSNGRWLPYHAVAFIGLGSFDNDFLTVVQQHLFFPGVTGAGHER